MKNRRKAVILTALILLSAACVGPGGRKNPGLDLARYCTNVSVGSIDESSGWIYDPVYRILRIAFECDTARDAVITVKGRS